MCFFSSSSSQTTAPATAPVPAAPVRTIAPAPNAGFAKAAQAAAITATGVSKAIATSPLGDTAFGAAVKKATFLGETAGAY